jgi:hypothetical protein
MERAVRAHPRVPFVGLAAAALLAASAAGCAHKPEMHLDHAEISGVQLATMPPSLGIVMTVVINVYNPNGYDVAVRAVRGQAVFANQYPLPVMFQGPPDGVWMAAGQTTPVRVPVTVPVQLALLLVQQGMQQPTIPYRFTGSADVTASHTFQIEKDNYSVDETGTITRDQMMAVIPNSLMAGAAQFIPH